MADWSTVMAMSGVGGVVLAWIVASHLRERRWHEHQRQRMKLDQPPLNDAEFLQAVRAEPDDAPVWLAARRAMADSIGLPPEAIRPEDRLANLGRLQCLGPDLMDLIFRLERSLRTKIPRRFIADFEGGRLWRSDGSFGDFAGALVRALSQSG